MINPAYYVLVYRHWEMICGVTSRSQHEKTLKYAEDWSRNCHATLYTVSARNYMGVMEHSFIFTLDITASVMIIKKVFLSFDQFNMYVNSKYIAICVMVVITV